MLERATLAAPIDVLLKINTGMNRLGFTADSLAALAQLRACRACAASP
jgi:alanine racemase